MIIGIGCDILNIKRVHNIINKFNNRFFHRVFTRKELKIGKLNYNIAYFAKRFSSKEAYAKALNYGIGKNISFQDIEILNDINGAPYFNRHPLKLNGVKAFLSISDEVDYAISYVLLEK